MSKKPCRSCDGVDRHRQHRSVANSYLRFDLVRSSLYMSWGSCGYALTTIIGAKKGKLPASGHLYAGDGVGDEHVRADDRVYARHLRGLPQPPVGR